MRERASSCPLAVMRGGKGPNPREGFKCWIFRFCKCLYVHQVADLLKSKVGRCDEDVEEATSLGFRLI